MHCAMALQPALENFEDYKAFEAAVISDYDAESTVERELVLRLASVLWRLRRATGIESALFDSIAEGTRIREHRPSCGSVVGVASSESNRLFLATAPEPDALARQQRGINSKEDIAASFLRLAERPTFALDRLSRYEHLLWRQARQIVFTLESLRRRKLSRSTFPFSFSRRA